MDFKYKAVFYDFDGTLVNTNSIMRKAWNHGFRILGTCVNDEFMEFQKGISSFDALDIPKYQNLDKFAKKNIVELKREYLDTIANFEEATLIHEPQLFQTLDFIKKNNLKLGVVTSQKKENVLKVIKTNPKLENYFNPKFNILCKGEDGYNNEKAMGIISLSKKLNLNREEVIYVGDGKADMEASKLANSRGIYFSPDDSISRNLNLEDYSTIKNHSELIQILNTNVYI